MMSYERERERPSDRISSRLRSGRQKDNATRFDRNVWVGGFVRFFGEEDNQGCRNFHCVPQPRVFSTS